MTVVLIKCPVVYKYSSLEQNKSVLKRIKMCQLLHFQVKSENLYIWSKKFITLILGCKEFTVIMYPRWFTCYCPNLRPLIVYIIGP